VDDTFIAAGNEHSPMVLVEYPLCSTTGSVSLCGSDGALGHGSKNELNHVDFHPADENETDTGPKKLLGYTATHAAHDVRLIKCQ